MGLTPPFMSTCDQNREETAPFVTLVMRIFALVAILVMIPEVQAATDDSPTQAVKSTITELLRILKTQTGWSRADERRSAIEQVIRRHVSYAEMAKRSLGEPWTELNGDEQREFVDLFVQMLRDVLANRMFEYSDERIIYLSEQREREWAKVATRLSGSKADTFVEFRLTYKSGQWFLYDAVIDGASMVTNYRAQFAAVLREVPYEGMVARMKQRTLLVKVFEVTSP
jgi:phospholipid transport system substrate-binding protein